MKWERKLRYHLDQGQGVRVGESAVVSRCLHLIAPAWPDRVSVLAHLDAGAVFYGRPARGEVIHLDVFHELADVDRHRVAAAVVEVLERQGCSHRAHFFDIQTATGGGRVTGGLAGGQRESLRRAHRTHVHVAGLLSGTEVELVVPLVRAVEEEILAQNLGIRRIVALRHVHGSGGSPLDLSPYVDQMDSWLRGPGAPPAPDGIQPGVPAQPHAAGSRAGDPGGHGSSPGGGPGPAGPGTGPTDAAGAAAGTAPGATAGRIDAPADPGGTADAAWRQALDAEARLQTALELARRLGSPEELKHVLDMLQSGREAPGAGAQMLSALRELEQQGVVRREARGMRLTPAGQALSLYLTEHMREVRSRFRRVVARVPQPLAASGCHPPVPANLSRTAGAARHPVPAAPGEWLTNIAVADSIRTAICAAHLAWRGAGPEAGERRWTLARDHIHLYRQTSQPPLDICLLIDASASMAGRRILAAKYLVRHLLAATRDRVAVIGFQERSVRVHVPFTRDEGRVEAELVQLHPFGLTPLAHGLMAGLELVKTRRVRRTLLLVITDGIPTVPRWTVDPLADALAAARVIRHSRVPFGCIGLMPARRYLDELAREAGGTLHIVDELDEAALVAVAHQERLRRQGGASRSTPARL